MKVPLEGDRNLGEQFFPVYNQPEKGLSWKPSAGMMLVLENGSPNSEGPGSVAGTVEVTLASLKSHFSYNKFTPSQISSSKILVGLFSWENLQKKLQWSNLAWSASSVLNFQETKAFLYAANALWLSYLALN